ncbi:MAG: hypothetical protein IJU72_10640 [Bacteroidales bacterium]|nr:hypothetical protein [Bacteroidales bacterium]
MLQKLHIGAALLLSMAAQAQPALRPPQNVRRVVVTFRYEVRDGQRLPSSCVVHQLISDSLGRAHTELDWDCATGEVRDYVWHTFSGQQVMATHTFRNGQLCLWQTFGYASPADSLPSSERIVRVSPGDTALYATIAYSQRGSSRIAVAKGPKGQRAWTAKSTYDTHGNELSRRVRAKRGFVPPDSIAELRRAPLYDAQGRLCAETIVSQRFDGPQRTQRLAYTHNDRGLLAERRQLDAQGRTIEYETMDYSAGGALKTISKHNAQGVLIDYHFKRYELYPSNNRQQRIVEHL